MDYAPQPIDISTIELDTSLTQLVEQLAKNTHEIWAVQRISDGWKWGKKRDDMRREHPCLIEYDELSEEEKEYDRKVTLGTLRTILKLGYRILPPQEDTQTKDTGLERILHDVENSKPELAELLTIWQHHDPIRWKQVPEAYLALGQKILKLGEPLIAYDVLTAGSDCLNDSVLISGDENNSERTLYIAFQQRRALALAQSGASKLAAGIIEKIIKYGADDGETAGIYGRICKDIAATTNDDNLRQAKLVTAIAIYQNAYENSVQLGDIDSAYYNGINAATLSLIAGDEEQSSKLAEEVKQICLRQRSKLKSKQLEPPYWLDATLGEAELLLNNDFESEKWYRSAVDRTCGAVRDISSMKKQVKAILRARNVQNTDFAEACFPSSKVVIFTGHRIDSEDRGTPRFPDEKQEYVRKQIARKLDLENAAIAYSSAASGADIIFLEEMLARGGEINIVLPFEHEHFVAESVANDNRGNWIERFENVVNRAAGVKVLGHFNEKIDMANHFEFANLYIYGAAKARCKQLSSELVTLAVWDGQSVVAKGGTACAVSNWQRLGHDVLQISPLGGEQILSGKQIKEAPFADRAITADIATLKHYAYLPMLFADVKGYSKLSEREVVDFSVSFLSRIGETIEKNSDGILSRRTQGDGLFLVFKDIETAIKVAQGLRQVIKTTDWSEYNLPNDLQMRISLDAGPTYSYIDPIVNKLEFCGDYVVRAARMEPVTPPGEIFVSDTFVAMAYSSAIEIANFDYAGQVPLPKNYGVVPAYHLSGKL